MVPIRDAPERALKNAPLSALLTRQIGTYALGGALWCERGF
jgi:hypothetical protein